MKNPAPWILDVIAFFGLFFSAVMMLLMAVNEYSKLKLALAFAGIILFLSMTAIIGKLNDKYHLARNAKSEEIQSPNDG